MTVIEILKDMKPDVDFEASKDYVDDMLLDSFDFMELIERLESTYGIEVKGKDILPENFVTADVIEELVRKSGGKIEQI